jgi:hypothetical protein
VVHVIVRVQGLTGVRWVFSVMRIVKLCIFMIFGCKVMKSWIETKSIMPPMPNKSIVPHLKSTMSLNCKTKQRYMIHYNKLSYLSIPCF